MDIQNTSLATQVIHADREIQPEITDLAPPLHVSTTFRKSEDQNYHWIYSRSDTPTRARVEKVLGALEGGYSITYSSGLSAIWAILQHAKPKYHLKNSLCYAFRCTSCFNRSFQHEFAMSLHNLCRCVMTSIGYHGTRGVLKQYQAATKSTGGEEMNIVPLSEDMKDVQLLILETPRNPDASLLDLENWVKLAKQHGAKVATDCTFLSPLGIQPLALGVDYSMHSCTKFLGGHSDVLGGVVSVKTPELHHQLLAARLLQGSILGNLESFLLLRSLRTLPLRMERHSTSAIRIAEWLTTQQEYVKTVWHPALPHHPSYPIFLAQLKLAPPCFSFEMHTETQAKLLPQRTHLFSEATSLGGAESLLEWRYQWDHTLSPCLVRISIGLEDPNDLINDLKQAFEFVSRPS